MTAFVRNTFIAAAAFAALAGCASDPLTSNTSAGSRAESALMPRGPAAQSVPMILKVARDTEAHGNLPTAASLYRRAHSLDPENFEAVKGLASALSKLGAYEEAAGAWRKALRLHPNDTAALRGLANTLVVMGHPELAIEHYERALAIKPEPKLYNGIGVALDMQDQYRMAQAYYRVGLKIAPNDLSLRNNLGLSLLLGHKIPEAVAELRRAAENAHAHTRNRLNLALALVLAGNTGRALTVARMDLDPKEAEQQIAYFETIRAMGDAPAARQAIQAHFRGIDRRQRKGATVDPLEGMSEAR